MASLEAAGIVKAGRHKLPDLQDQGKVIVCEVIGSSAESSKTLGTAYLNPADVHPKFTLFVVQMPIVKILAVFLSL